jgi:putative transposase
MKRNVYEIVREKRAWEGPMEPEEAAYLEKIGSKRWHTRGYLPHYDKPGTIQMVTFRLADSMPANLRHEWEPLQFIEDARKQRIKVEEYLDKGRGECLLRDVNAAVAMEGVLLRFDQVNYRLMAWVVMPNHVHVLFEQWDLPLGALIKAWKGSSARIVNLFSRRTGQLWQADFWDRYIRDENHFQKARQYIEQNPVKAHLVQRATDWPNSSASPKWLWTAEDRYLRGRLLNGPKKECLERGHSCPP